MARQFVKTLRAAVMIEWNVSVSIVFGPYQPKLGLGRSFKPPRRQGRQEGKRRIVQVNHGTDGLTVRLEMALVPRREAKEFLAKRFSFSSLGVLGVLAVSFPLQKSQLQASSV
jgi:hypothetical protein